MKYVNVLGLAAVTATALTTFVGGGTASATVLCKTEGIKSGGVTGTTCPQGWAFPAETAIHAVNEGVGKLTTTFKNIECAKSTISGKTVNEGTAIEAVTVNVETFTLEECNCEFKVLIGGTWEIDWIEGTHSGTLTSNTTETTMSCSTIFGSIHCIFSTNHTHIGTLTGSASVGDSTATTDIDEANIPRLTTNALCAEKAKWDMKYSITTPDTVNTTGHT